MTAVMERARVKRSDCPPPQLDSTSPSSPHACTLPPPPHPGPHPAGPAITPGRSSPVAMHVGTNPVKPKVMLRARPSRHQRCQTTCLRFACPATMHVAGPPVALLRQERASHSAGCQHCCSECRAAYHRRCPRSSTGSAASYTPCWRHLGIAPATSAVVRTTCHEPTCSPEHRTACCCGRHNRQTSPAAVRAVLTLSGTTVPGRRRRVELA